MSQPEKPLGIALLVCDQIITEARTNKKSLIGCFNQIAARTFPCVRDGMAVFVSITNGNGRMNAALRCVRESSEQIIFETSGPIDFETPMHTVDIGFLLENVAFPEPGSYCFEFYCDDELLLHRRFAVRAVKPKSE